MEGTTMISIRPNVIKFNESLISELERGTKIDLVREYIDFLRKYNGGIPEPNIVVLDKEEIKSFSVTSFFGVGLESYDDLVTQYNLFKHRIPEGCLPIARVEGGNIVCICLLPERYGFIYLWDHDVELLYDKPSAFEHLIPIAKSFEEFLNRLTPYNPEEENLVDYKVEEVWIDPDFLKKLEDGSKD